MFVAAANDNEDGEGSRRTDALFTSRMAKFDDVVGSYDVQDSWT